MQSCVPCFSRRRGSFFIQQSYCGKTQKNRRKTANIRAKLKIQSKVVDIDLL